MDLHLSERQRTTAAAAVTVLATTVILVAVGMILYLLSAFLISFSHVFLPIAVAGVAALILKPYYEWWETRRLPPPLALSAVFFSILLPIVALLWFFGALIVGQATDLVNQIPGWWQSAADYATEHWPEVVEISQRHGISDQLAAAAEGQGGMVLSALSFIGGKALSAGISAFGAIGALLGWVVLPVYIAFFLFFDPPQTRWVDVALPFFKSETRDDVAYLVDEFLEILVAFFRGQLLIALMQGILFAVGFSLVGLSYGLILGLTLGFLNIIPYLGSIVGLGVALPLAFFQEGGGIWTVVAVLVVFTIVQTIEGYLLTPKIMGDQTGLHPMAIMVAIFFWGSALNGILGMILAIPLTAFFVVFWRLAREKYIRELV